jgi:hypothetical protein
MQCPNCRSYATRRSGLLGCWARVGGWFGWLIVMLGLEMLWAARVSAYSNAQPLDLRFVVGGAVVVIVGLSPYLLRLHARRAWACRSCNYHWRIV